MGSELVDSPIFTEGVANKATPFIFTKLFYEALPIYLALGMSADEFWNGDVWLAKAYRKADEYRKDMDNQRLWLQGLYIYDALMLTAQKALSDKKTNDTYPSEPYPISTKAIEDRKEKEKQAKLEAGKSYMEQLAMSLNKRRERKENVSND